MSFDQTMSVEEALRVVAQGVMASLLEYLDESWENYPELSQRHWEDIQQMVRNSVNVPTSVDWQAAYRLLTVDEPRSRND
jgi:hypothetical protein